MTSKFFASDGQDLAAATTKELQGWLEGYLNDYLSERSLDLTLARFGPQIMAVGTGADEFAPDRETVELLYRRDLADVPGPIDYTLRCCHAGALSDDIGQILAELDVTMEIAGQQVSLKQLRMSLLLRRSAGKWLAEQMHLSLPTNAHEEGEAYPVRELEERARVLERMVAEQTRELTRTGQSLSRVLASEQRMRAAQDQFVEMICHEFRNPLAIIKTQLDIMAMGATAQEFDDSMDMIGKAVSSLEDILKQSLREQGWTQPVNLSYENIDLVELIANSLEQLKVLWQEKGVEPRQVKFFHGYSVVLWTNRKLLETIVGNLLDNAGKYGAPGIPIRIEIKCGDDYVEICMGNGYQPGETMDPERLLARGYRGKSSTSFPGSGMGLGLVEKLVGELGGQFNISIDDSYWFEARVAIPLASAGEKKE
jgi:signal transduction histidine kinase